MQGIYTYIPETNHVPREHCVAAIHGAYIASSCVDSIVSLRKHFPNCVCSAQYDCFL
jgi:hypothetical protein